MKTLIYSALLFACVYSPTYMEKHLQSGSGGASGAAGSSQIRPNYGGIQHIGAGYPGDIVTVYSFPNESPSN